MEKEYLVITYIGRDGKARAFYYDKEDSLEHKAKMSFLTAENKIAVPLWFKDRISALDYVEQVAFFTTEREYLLIQEFTYENEIHQAEAKIVFSIKSDTWPSLDQGRTERSPGIWANVRLFFLFDKESAFDYIRRFNGSAAEKYKTAHEGKAGDGDV